MDMTAAVKSATTNFFNFRGRAVRSEFWWFMLFVLICGWVADAISPLVRSYYSLFILIPLSAVLVRRLHDVGKSGWYCLLFFGPLLASMFLILYRYYSIRRQGIISKIDFQNHYPIANFILGVFFMIGSVWLLVLLVLKSQPKDNIWGTNPQIGISENDLDEFGVKGNNR